MKNKELERASKTRIPYDKVRIVGPDWNDFFEAVLQDKSFSFDPDCILIGDGKRPVKLKEIREKLTGRLSQSTQIEIHAHGFTVPGSEEHYIDLSLPWYTYGGFLFEHTSTLLKALNCLGNDQSIQIFINSCYSGLANKIYKRSIYRFNVSNIWTKL